MGQLYDCCGIKIFGRFFREQVALQLLNISKCYLIKAAKHDAEEADSRYNEAMRKMRMLQAELDKAEDRANEIENKNTMLQEELKEAGMNVKSLRVK